MAAKPFRKEQLNYFKFASVVQDEFPKMLRQTFVTKWDKNIAILPGYQVWDDSATVRSQLLRREGGKTDIPTTKTIEDWDCTALFKATIYCKTFGLTTPKSIKTLSQQYLAGKKPSPFHTSVISPTGNYDETFTLAIDQLRLLRNTLCHIPKSGVSKADFDQYVQLAKDAFTAAGVSSVCINDIGCLREEDFPTEKIDKINDQIKFDLQENNKFLQQDVKEELADLKCAQETFFHGIDKKLQETQACKNEMLYSLPDSCVPPLTPDFVGRTEECDVVVEAILQQSTRLFSIWGSPGFGKTSTAIAIGNRIKSAEKAIYYFSLRGVYSMKEFISKLLGLFGRSTDSNRTVNITPTDELLRAFGSITVPFYIVLDNLDDLLTSSDKKEEVSNFLNDVLHRCQNICFLTTTRESLEFLALRMQGFDSLRLKPLDAQSSEVLILKYLPATAPGDLKSQISKICGNVPLALRLLCALIKDNPQELLHEIRQGSENVLDVIDDPNYLSHDSRLKQLIQVSFDRLSAEEKHAFVSLSVFNNAPFGLGAATAIIGGGKLQVKRNIENLIRKSLVDVVEGELYVVHPLIQSFSLEKGEKEMENVMASSKTRFLQYYINFFETLNLRFLEGESMPAFTAFFMEEQRILFGLTNGLNDDVLLEKVVTVLQNCEFFLDSVYPNSLVEIELLYDSAMSKMSNCNNDRAYAGLYVSKLFFATTFVSKSNSVLQQEDEETRVKISLLPSSTQGKLLCYKGIYELSNGEGESAAQHIEDGLSLLGDSPEHIFLTVLVFQMLLTYYKNIGNSVKFAQFREKAVEIHALNSVFFLRPLFDGNSSKKVGHGHGMPSLRNGPLIAWAIARLSLWTRKYLLGEWESELRKILDEVLQQIYQSSVSVRTAAGSALLQLCDMAYIHLCVSNNPSDLEEIIESLRKDLENMKGDQFQPSKEVENTQKLLALLRVRVATYYRTIAVQRFGNGESALELFVKELEYRQQLPADAKLAETYRCIGNEQNRRREYESALQSHTSALITLQELYGETHADLATSYYNIGIVQDNIGDNEASLRSYFCALKISLQHNGANHPHSAMIQERINRHPFCLMPLGKKEHCGERTRCEMVQKKVFSDLNSKKRLLRSTGNLSYRRQRRKLIPTPKLFRLFDPNEQHGETIQSCFFEF